jgi:hypothetical protein
MQLCIYSIISNNINDAPAVDTTTVYVRQKLNFSGLHNHIHPVPQTRVSSQIRDGSIPLKCVWGAVRGANVLELSGARKGWLYIKFSDLLLHTDAVSELPLQDWVNTGPPVNMCIWSKNVSNRPFYTHPKLRILILT